MKILLAIVGMPGSGKSCAVQYLQDKGIPFVRFGDVTEEGLHAKGLPITPKTEQAFREKIRRELGMAAYAIKSLPKIEKLLLKHDVIVIDGLYSWSEYTYLKERFENLILIHIYAEPKIRYKRLRERPVRPFTEKEARVRDIAEIEALDKGGTIAIADYLVVNNANLPLLHKRIDKVLKKIGIKHTL